MKCVLLLLCVCLVTGFGLNQTATPPPPSANSSSSSLGVVAWIDGDGLVKSSSDSSLRVTHLSDGHYCIAGDDLMSGFLPVFVTLQTNGRGTVLPLFVQANNGWGDECNSHSYLSVHIFDVNGKYHDNAFSIAVVPGQ